MYSAEKAGGQHLNQVIKRPRSWDKRLSYASRWDALKRTHKLNVPPLLVNKQPNTNCEALMEDRKMWNCSR